MKNELRSNTNLKFWQHLTGASITRASITRAYLDMCIRKLGCASAAGMLALVAIVLISGCHPVNDSSQVNAVVGLEAGIRDGKSPTFAALGHWYQQFKINFATHSNDNSAGRQVSAVALKNNLDPAAKGYLLSWIDDQNKRLSAFRDAISQRDSEAVRSLLDAEAWEMYEIAAAFLFPSYIPKTPGNPDRLAMLIRVLAAKGMGTDLFAEEFLSEAIQDRNLKSVYEFLDQERVNYAAAMRAKYLGTNGGIRELREVINRSQVGLNNLLNVLHGGGVQGFGLAFGNNPGSQLSQPAPVSGSGGLLGQLIGVLSGSSAGSQSYGTYAGGKFGSSGKPALSIFQGKDLTDAKSASGGDASQSTQPTSPNVFVPPGSSSGNVDSNSSANNSLANTSTEPVMALVSQLLSDWGGGMGLAESFASNQVPLSRDLHFGKVHFNCNDGSRTGIALVRCHRYLAFLPPAHELVSTVRREMSLYEDSSPLDIDETEFSLTGDGYNVDGPAFYYTQVQEQRDGSCTAYGLTHTVIRNAMQVTGDMDHDAQWASAEKLWQKQGRQPYVEVSIRAAKSGSYKSPNGTAFRITKSRSLRSQAEMKAVIDEGRAVYAASGVGSSWDNAFSGMKGAIMACDGGGDVGHAYSIQGYDDSKQLWIVKNSWGSRWGEDGYGYLPYKCFRIDGMMTLAFDLEVGGN